MAEETKSYKINTSDDSIFEGTRASIYLQNAVIAGLMHNVYMLALVKDQMDESYFKDPSCCVIFRGLVKYYEDYQDIPKDMNTLNLSIDRSYINLGATKDQVLSRAKDLFVAGKEIQDNEKFITKCAEELIVKIRTNKAASKALDKLKNNIAGELDTQELVQDMIDSMSVNLAPSPVYTMSDLKMLERARKEAYGDGDSHDKVIKSCMPSINKILQYQGYQVGTLNLFVASPGCFTGDTKIMTLDGKSHTLQEMYENKMRIGIYGCDKEGNLSTDIADSIYLSDYVTELIEVEVDRFYKIKCTPDHPFMLRDGKYKRADELKVEDKLMPITREKVKFNQYKKDEESEVFVKIGKDKCEMIFNKDKKPYYTSILSSNSDCNNIGYIQYKDNNRMNNYPDNIEINKGTDTILKIDKYKIKNIVKYYVNTSKVTKVTKMKLEVAVPVYGIVNAGRNQNYAIVLNKKRGIFVSNTGKTSFLINEASFAAQQGKTVMHIYLGDMVYQDSTIRYLSNITGILQNDIARMSEEEQAKLIVQTNEYYPGVMDRINYMCFPTGEITVNELIEMIKKDQIRNEKHYDLINVDYADNFKKVMDNNYIESGYIYERLAWFGRVNKTVVLVASQPKLTYWGDEIIPLEGAAESSRKQHIVDTLFSIGRAAKGLNFGTFFAAKVRRGQTGGMFRYQSHWERCKIEEINDNQYKDLRSANGI